MSKLEKNANDYKTYISLILRLNKYFIFWYKTQYQFKALTNNITSY